MLKISLGRMLLGATFVMLSMGTVAAPEPVCTGQANNPNDGGRWGMSCEGADGKSYANLEVTPADESSGMLSIQITEQLVCRDGMHIACRIPHLSGGDGSATCLSKGVWIHPYKGPLPGVLMGCACFDTAKSCKSE